MGGILPLINNILFSMISYPTLGTFIVTLSLAHRLAMLASPRFLVPALRSPEMLSFNARFCSMMRRLIAPHTLYVIDSYRLMNVLRTKAMELAVQDHSKVILATCADMTPHTGFRSLAINRLYNPFGICIGYVRVRVIHQSMFSSILLPRIYQAKKSCSLKMVFLQEVLSNTSSKH